MANDSRDLINRPAQLPHNHLILLWVEIVKIFGRGESFDDTDMLMFIYVDDEDHDEDSASFSDYCGRKPHWRKRQDDRHHR